MAFLLYRCGDYIADVLPELGEEQVAEIDFDGVASAFLDKVTDYEKFSEQVVKLIDRVDEAAAQRVRYKATPEFVAELDEWIASRADEDFSPALSPILGFADSPDSMVVS
ncbi:hypothetical protein [Saccharopolyspora griseoalba]|uniref:CdiI immunity protein domain-containing protein n=1 Tax=Saccharopolyspora griseoalba TaxID=1431848 RepID=A0ABW2LQ71_9PSEU